ncbi:hypothetical protein J1N35_018670 [Gossypium stocksii]|uniref:Uncharacterized protein n=1 Tax=Gossypium stocksii TaxID=47602 RepID=A0A9D3VRN5_9ROSI|nr:hypothetical protein J1N35_018670 [Gossypium stocksii]
MGNSEDVSSPEDLITKKVRFKESEVITDDGLAAEDYNSRKKDMLLGKDTSALHDTNGGHFLVDNFSFSEGDVKKSIVDGVPSIEFSERVYQLLENEMSTSVVLKMLGRNLGIKILHNRL